MRHPEASSEVAGLPSTSEYTSEPRDTYVLAVQIHPSSTCPHHLGSRLNSGTYVRVGSTNRLADEPLIEEMRRFVRGKSFDSRPLPEVDSEALDFRAASESFAEFRRLDEGELDILGLRTAHQGRKVATVGGVLLFGLDRLARFPDAWIQAGRFDGTNKARIAAQADLKMPLTDAIPAAVEFVERHTERGIEIGPVRRETLCALPPVAVREAIINAVAYADYAQRGGLIRIAVFDDRLEVENPGLLPFGLTVEDLPRGVSKLRNRVIGRVFHELRLVEQWGSGAQRMIAACEGMGLPPTALGGTRQPVARHAVDGTRSRADHRPDRPGHSRSASARRRHRPINASDSNAAGYVGRRRHGGCPGQGAAGSQSGGIAKLRPSAIEGIASSLNRRIAPRPVRFGCDGIGDQPRRAATCRRICA